MFNLKNIRKELKGEVYMILEMKHIILCAACSLFTAVGAQAQEVVTDSVVNNQDSLMMKTDSIQPAAVQNPDNKDTAKMSDEELEKHWNEVWGRAKYFNIAFAKQSLKSDYETLNSSMAFSVEYGRTYYLHKKPIAGLLKFGIDVNFMDISFAKYPDMAEESEPSPMDDEEEPLIDLGIMQMEYGIGVGPSVTVNPVDHLKACLFFHVTPSYSLMLQNSSLYHHYATFFNVGLTVAYRMISIGVEHRWCGKVNYDGLSMDHVEDVYDDEGNFHDPFESVGALMKTNTWRFFIGFRF